jgi:hypothetical protein
MPSVGIGRIEVSEDLFNFVARFSSPVGASVDSEADSAVQKAHYDCF